MTAKKLSDSDKQEILNWYRQTGETTSTLAERYGVSNSTISRLLKVTLPEEEYEALISTKRAARTYGGDATKSQTSLFAEPEPEPDVVIEQPLLFAEPEPEPDVAVAEPLIEVEHSEETAEQSLISKRIRRRSSAASKPEIQPPAALAEEQLEPLEAGSEIAISNPIPLDEDTGRKPVLQPQSPVVDSSPIPLDEDTGRKPILQPQSPVVDSSPTPLDEDRSIEEASAAAEMLGEELLDESEELMDLDDEDLDDDELDEDDLDEESFSIRKPMPTQTLVQVLPLSEATLPKTCYLVIDRASELITRPLRDFGDLGQIPNQEFQQKTLPIFDNHRVARRFSTKRDRVIKVPDSKMLQKTRSHLQAKGITRLLVDGQVYSLLR